MDQADHKEIISPEAGYAKATSEQVGTILLYPMTTKEAHHMFSTIRTFMLRSQTEGRCSRLERIRRATRAEGGTGSEEHTTAFSYTEQDLCSAAFHTTGILTDNTGLPYTDNFLVSPLAHFSPPPINFSPYRTSSQEIQSQFTYRPALCF